MAATIVTAMISFVSTNIDDIFVLTLLFCQTDKTMKKSDIVMGQYIGIGILVGISLLGAFGLNLFPEKYVGLLGFLPIFLGIKAWLDDRQKEESDISQTEGDIQESTEAEDAQAKRKTKSQILTVMLITLANGADNIGIYVPLFSRFSFGQLMITVVIFMLMIGLWCLIGSQLGNYPLIKTKIQQYRHLLVPIVFIGLGIFIILESGVFGFN